jgi:hypothetical protein
VPDPVTSKPIDGESAKTTTDESTASTSALIWYGFAAEPLPST